MELGWQDGPPGTPLPHPPLLEGKPRTPLSSRVATRVSWSPLSGLKGDTCIHRVIQTHVQGLKQPERSRAGATEDEDGDALKAN